MLASRLRVRTFYCSIPLARILAIGLSFINISILAAASTQAQSFDCDVRDLNLAEQTICQNEALSWYDDAISALYQDLREPKDNETSDRSFDIRRTQRFWLEQRNLCEIDEGCIQATQRERLAELGKLTQHDIKESHFDFYGNWRIKTEDMGGNFLLVATSKGEAFLSLATVRKNQGAHLCQLQFDGGRVFQNSIVWPNQTSLEGETCMLIISRDDDELVFLEQSECQPYWCGGSGYFEGLYERRSEDE